MLTLSAGCPIAIEREDHRDRCYGELLLSGKRLESRQNSTILNVANAKSTPQPLSTKRRAAGRILSPKNIRSTQSLPSSDETARTVSGLLTPFRPSPRSMSPPPKPEADDYLNVHGHYNDGQRQPNRKGRKRYRSMEEHEEPRPDPLNPVSRPRTVSAAESGCDVCPSKGYGSDIDSASEAPLVKDWKLLVMRTDTRALAGAMYIDPARDRTWPQLSNSNSRDDDAESPAVNALRSMSQPQPKKSDLESQKLRRMSSAFANSFNFLKSRTATTHSGASTQSMSPKWDLPSGRRSKNKRSFGFRESERRRPNLGKGKEVSGRLTPSSITLRKASNANVVTLPGSSMSASLIYEDENLRSSEAPATELLAFYSSRTNESSSITSSDVQSPCAALSPLTLIRDTSSKTEPPLPQTTCLPAVHSSEVRRQSVTAENALTFIDVHIAPGTFLVNAKSRKRSLAVAEPPPRRISVVQFRSRNSIHEIIWREDETTGSSSLASSSHTSESPPRIGQSVRYAEPRLEGEDGQTKEGPITPMPVDSVQSSLIEQPQVGLFQWSWGHTASTSDVALQENERKSDCPDLTQLTRASNPESSRARTISDPHATIASHKRSMSEIQDILSFPPLRDRSSTCEWQKGPLIDINAPLVGRGNEPQLYEVTKTNDGVSAERGSRAPELLREDFGGKRSVSHPRAPARNGLSGRAGSSVGSSSHARVHNGHRSSFRERLSS